MLHRAESWLPLCCIARSHDSPWLCNIALSRLRAMQHNAESLLKIFSIEIRLDCIARSSSAILGEKNSALCCIARSQLTERWLCATAFKATSSKNASIGKLPYLILVKWGLRNGAVQRKFCCFIARSRFFDSLRPNISSNSKRNSKIL
jgi:hypothetical protein